MAKTDKENDIGFASELYIDNYFFMLRYNDSYPSDTDVDTFKATPHNNRPLGFVGACLNTDSQ